MSNDLKQDIKNLITKINSCSSKIDNLSRGFIELESKVNTMLARNIKWLLNNKPYVVDIIKELAEFSSDKISLQTFIITYMAEENGFLDIECEKCEVIINQTSTVIVLKSLKNLYIEKNEVVLIKNPVDLKSVKFRKLEKPKEDLK